MKRKITITISAILVCLSLFQVACKKDETPSPNEVSIGDDTFTPSSLRISKGTTVKWTNNGMDIHTVTSSGALFDSGDLDPGETYSRLFDSIGTFPYICIYHLGMSGTVIVE